MGVMPKKLYYKIGEVCDLCQIQPHVLRYWETEFSQLSPSKNSSGQRVYRYKDLLLVRRIKQLLYEEGYTIAGANKKLATEDLLAADPALASPPGRSDGRAAPKELKREILPLFPPSSAGSSASSLRSGQTRELVETIRSEARSLLEILRDPPAK